MMDKFDLAKMIKAERLRRRMSQEQFGSIFGVSRAAVCLWESGKSAPCKNLINDVLKEIGISEGLNSPKTGSDRFLTVREAADRIGIPYEEVAEWIRESYIEHFRLPNGRIRIKPEAIDEFVEQCRVEARTFKEEGIDV